MTTEEIRQVVRRIVADVVNRGDMGAFDELVDPAYRDHTDPAGAFGKEGYRDLILRTRAALPDLHMTIEDELVDGDRVVIRVSVRGTHRGTLLGVPPTGRPVAFIGIGILRIADGRLVERWNVSDLLTLLEQIGGVTLDE